MEKGLNLVQHLIYSHYYNGLKITYSSSQSVFKKREIANAILIKKAMAAMVTLDSEPVRFPWLTMATMKVVERVFKAFQFN